MNEIKFSELDTAIKNNSYNFYNIYNSDLNLPIYYAVEHYINNVEDTTDIDQKLHIIFLDIEVYWKDRSIKFDFEVSDHPINAITVYSTDKKIFKSYYLLHDFNFQLFGITPNCNIDEIYNNHISTYKEWLLAEKYISPEEDIEISVYNDESQLLLDVWKYIREVNPISLSGFNSDGFDYPYIYRRMLKLWNNDKLTVDSIISQFKQVDFQQNGYLKIIDYPICDIQFLYKTRDDGGANLGKKLASYSLDFMSEEELSLTKLEYKTKNIDIHEFYEKDPINFLLYNISDVCLCVRLNEKLKHIELQNLIRRNMKLGFAQSLIGSSALYDAYVLYELHGKNYKIRHGIVTEMGKEIIPERLTKIPTPQTKNNKVKADKISKQEYMSAIYGYEGAYVKQSTAKIINTGVIIDLDATSLYPSMMRQYNIGFDTYRARIISPLAHKTLTILEEYIGKKPIPSNLFANVYEMVDAYVEKEGAPNKTKAKNQLYYIISYHIFVLSEKGIHLSKIFNPSNNNESILLKHYLIPLLDIIDAIHTNHESYNGFVYDYIFDPVNDLKSKYKSIYLINNANSPSQHIEKLDTSQLLEKINNLIVTINGACYAKHEDKLGLFVNFLTEMGKLRKQYRKLASEFPRNSEKHVFYNSRQLAIKVLMNRCAI